MSIITLWYFVLRMDETSFLTRLLRRRVNTASSNVGCEHINFRDLEKDLVFSFLVGKPVISDYSLLRVKYQFKTCALDTIK